MNNKYNIRKKVELVPYICINEESPFYGQLMFVTEEEWNKAQYKDAWVQANLPKTEYYVTVEGSNETNQD